MDRRTLRSRLTTPDYDFLRTDLRLGERILLLGFSGSYAYGLEKPDGSSDLDLRGIAANSPSEILLGQDFEQVVAKNTDTTIYSFNKAVRLLTAANPGALEFLGLRPQEYLYVSEIGRELINNADMFLSRKVIDTFSGYAAAQQRRLEGKSARTLDVAGREAHVLESIENVVRTFPGRYALLPDDGLNLYVDVSDRSGCESEIFMDLKLTHYPLRDAAGLWAEMNNVAKEYDPDARNREKPQERVKLGKHMAHLVRLYLMCFDILEKGEILSYREKEHDLLMDLRAGKYLDEQNQPVPAFYALVDRLKQKLAYDSAHTLLPEEPDRVRIDAFRMRVNRQIVESSV